MTEKPVLTTWGAEKRPERSEFNDMSAVAEASILLRRIAEPRAADDSVKTLIVRAARRVSKFFPITPSRAEDIWRREARLIRAEEMDAIRKAADARIIGEATLERTRLEDRIARLEAALSIQDPDFHEHSLDALRGMAGRKDSTVE